MGISLVTLAEYKAYANITSTNQDVEINAIIPKISELVKSLCKRTFVDYVDDAKVDIRSGGYPKLLLSEYPLLAVSSIEYSNDFGNTYTALTEFTDYAIDLEDGSISTTAYDRTGYTVPWAKLINGYKITYTAGYETVPSDLKLACLDLITYYLRNDGAVHSSRSAGSNQIQIEYITKSTLPAHISRILDLYTASFD